MTRQEEYSKNVADQLLRIRQDKISGVRNDAYLLLKVQQDENSRV